MKYTHSGLLISLALGGCATIPPLADEKDLPVEFIVNDTVCQIGQAFRNVDASLKSVRLTGMDPGVAANPEFKALSPTSDFDPRTWAMSVTLTPHNKLDVDIGLGASWTNRPNDKTVAPKIVAQLASVAGLPAADFNFSGETAPTVAYTIHSAVFFNQRNSRQLAEKCHGSPQEFQYDVTKNLGVESWLRRFLAPVDGKIISLGGKPSGDDYFSFHQTLTVYYGAGVGPTYSLQSGHWSGAFSAGAKRTQEIDLQIAFVKDTKGAKGPGAAASTGASQALNNIKLLSTLQRVSLPR